jgi:hypothetical protein
MAGLVRTNAVTARTLGHRRNAAFKIKMDKITAIDGPAIKRARLPMKKSAVSSVALVNIGSDQALP